MKTLRQPGATRGGRIANYWYEVRMRDTRKEELRRVMFKNFHPIEKWIRVALGPITLEGIPRGRYRLLEESQIEALRTSATPFARTQHALEQETLRTAGVSTLTMLMRIVAFSAVGGA